MARLLPLWLPLSVLLVGCTRQLVPIHELSNTKLPTAVAIAWSTDSSFVAAGLRDGTIHIWNVQTGQEVARGDKYPQPNEPFPNFPYALSGLAFSPDGQILAFGTADGSVRLWRFREGTAVDLIDSHRPIALIRFSIDGSRLAVASGGLTYPPQPPTTQPRRGPPRWGTPEIAPTTVAVFDAHDGRLLSQIHLAGYAGVAFSPDLRVFAGARANPDQPPASARTIQLKEIKSCDLEVRNTATGNELNAWHVEHLLLPVLFSPDGELLLLHDGIYDWHTGRLVLKFPQGQLFSGGKVFLPNGKTLLEVQYGTGLWSDLFTGHLLAPTGWVKLTYANIQGHGKHTTAKLVGPGSRTMSTPFRIVAYEYAAQFSPDCKLAIDRSLRIWPVPR